MPVYSSKGASVMLTEDQIERHVERMIDRLDVRFVRGALTQAEYDLRMRAIDDWAQREYPFSRTANRIVDMQVRS